MINVSGLRRTNYTRTVKDFQNSTGSAKPKTSYMASPLTDGQHNKRCGENGEESTKKFTLLD